MRMRFKMYVENNVRIHHNNLLAHGCKVDGIDTYVYESYGQDDALIVSKYMVRVIFECGGNIVAWSVEDE